MALNETKFCLFWIVVSAVFILLSVSANAEQQVEGHRCYWCGPLAEQVHRSQRASTCNGDKSKVTVCDEDLPYCAIVATAPPYIESRLCVKFYQDECYSLFCNSTKTWRMTCPCRGELCNGVNTKRESEAFEMLLKHHVAKMTQNKRPKRGLISKAGFIGVSTRKNKIDNSTEESKDVHNETVSANIVTEDVNESKQDANPTEVVNAKDEDSQITSTHAVVETQGTTERPTETAKTEVITTESPATTKVEAVSTESFATAAIEISAENSEAKATNVMDEPVNNTERPDTPIITTVQTTIENNDKQVSNPSIQIDIPSPNIDTGDLKTEIILMSTEVPKLINDTKTNDMVTKMAESVSKNQTNTLETKTATDEIKATPETTTLMVKTTVATLEMAKKTSEKLPTAEALQHNDTPTTKPTEQMSINITTVTLNPHIDIGTQATMPRNNTAVRLNSRILTIVIGIILHY